MIRAMKSLVRRVFPHVLAWRFFKHNGLPYDKPWIISRVLHDAELMRRENGFTYSEFVGYHFLDKTIEERLKFVNDFDHEVFAMKVNEPSVRILLDDKFRTYKCFKEYYGRECIDVRDTSEETKLKYQDFVSRHPRFMMKPHNAALGIGCKIVDTTKLGFSELWEMSEGEQAHYSHLIGHVDICGFVCEELIVENEDLSSFHPSSLNTFRVATIKKKDGDVDVIHACFRMGQGGAVVDNAGAGGILCSVDLKSGCLSKAVDELGGVYEVHPNSKKRIEGFVVPRWQEALDFVHRLACVVDGLRYGAWDIVLTKTGWVMVEANYDGQFIWQYPQGKGCRDELNEWIKEMGFNFAMTRPMPIDWESLRNNKGE